MFPKSEHLSWLRNPVWIALAAAIIGWIITQTQVWRHVELRLFDFLVVQAAPNQVQLPITLVGIDETTFAELKTNWPLPRRYHARLLDNLREAGVVTVGFDMVFANPSTPKDDQAFVEAIRRFGYVVLASDLSFREDSAMRQWYRVDPHRMFLDAGAKPGYSSMQVDDDAALRAVPTVNDSFWRMMLAQFDIARPNVVSSLDASSDMRIRYLGGPNTFTYIPYHQLLEPEKYLSATWKEFLRDNIVLVGRKVSVIGDVGAAQGEVYQTPFYYRTREFMTRMEAHANVIANMVNGDALREAPRGWSVGAWASAVFTAIAFMYRFHPLWSSLLLAAMLALLAGGEFGLFHYRQTWIPLAGSMLTVALIYLAYGSVAFLAEQRQRREIKSAFSMYVSPDLVEQVIAHPERLRLGGERRPLTILFSDLAGFTTFSERMDPEEVSRVINRHLSEMTDTIQGHSGTVEKFLGDGIMAFWGAPVAVEKHQEQAVKAAIEMQKRMREMSAEIEKATGAVIGMRIGINCGECIVGNMGGNNRFDYTAVGDAVNLAARLEGVNKVYGTDILMSEAVVKATDAGIRFREVDTVRVKGKRIGITVFTPCPDEALIAMTAEALAAWRAGRLDEAQSAWQRIANMYPSDPVAKSFLDRAAAFRKEGLPDGWDGVNTLDVK